MAIYGVVVVRALGQPVDDVMHYSRKQRGMCGDGLSGWALHMLGCRVWDGGQIDGSLEEAK